jgi:insulysin
MRKLFFSFSLFSCCMNSLSISEEVSYQIIEDKNDLKVLTPSLSDRKIVKIKLSNNMEAYLVSDPQADESAAAVSVGVGSWSDPKEYPGMAHFLEHMLFMGTKAYPDEKAFSQFISDHGGTSNAYTALDKTVYMFSVNNDGYLQALDLFSHFFIDPLFKTSEVSRELHAVDQEHAKNIQSDGRRKWMIFKETGNPSHPNRAFATGNAETLGTIPREALVNWYNQNYSANLMRLVMYSPLPIDQLKEAALKYFSSVKDYGYSSEIPYDFLSSQKQRGHITYIKPIKDLKILCLEWELPKEIAHERKFHSADIVAHALEYSGKNSLIEELKQEGLAEALEAGASRYSSDHMFLSLNLYLTKNGVNQVEKVIEKCFETIHELKRDGIPDYIFDELKTMSLIHYEYQSRDRAFEFVSRVSDDLLCESISTYPKETVVPNSFNKKQVSDLLTFLTPKHCIFTVIAPSELSQKQPTHKEKWNGGEYTLCPLSHEKLKSWEIPKGNIASRMPKPNPYLPKHLTLVTKESKEQKELPTPTLVSENNFGKHFIWEDTKYKTPESIYVFGIKSKELLATSKSSVATDLMIKTFYQKCSPLLSVAATAGLNCSLDQKNLKLLLTIKGYSEKAPHFAKNVITALKSLECSEDEFTLYKESLSATYSNQGKNQPYQIAGEFISNVLYNDAPLSKEKLKALKNLSYEEFQAFLHSFFTESYVEGLYSGNVDKESIKGLLADTISKISSHPFEDHMNRKVLLLPSMFGPYMIKEKIESLGHATLLAIQYGTFSFEKKAIQLVLNTVLSENFFNTLRSQQQTGYITASWPREVEKELMQFFLVQSSTHQPEDLLARFELFLEGYVKDFTEKLPNERFEEIKRNCIETLKQTPPNLDEMTAKLYDLAFERSGDFSFSQKLCLALEKLTYEEVKKEAAAVLSRKNGRRLALLAEGEIPDAPFLYKEISASDLKEKGSYISNN